jgi:hypothetical protein
MQDSDMKIIRREANAIHWMLVELHFTSGYDAMVTANFVQHE